MNEMPRAGETAQVVGNLAGCVAIAGASDVIAVQPVVPDVLVSQATASIHVEMPRPGNDDWLQRRLQREAADRQALNIRASQQQSNSSRGRSR